MQWRLSDFLLLHPTEHALYIKNSQIQTVNMVKNTDITKIKYVYIHNIARRTLDSKDGDCVLTCSME